MPTPHTHEPFDFNAYRRKRRKENPVPDLEQRKRSALNLLEREGCIVGGVVVHDPREEKRSFCPR